MSELYKNTWDTIKIDRITVPVWSWKYTDVVIDTKLDACLKRFGQHVALVVRETTHEFYELIDGRCLLAAMSRLQWDEAKCVNVGRITEQEAKELALALDIRYEISYAALSQQLLAMTSHISANKLSSYCGFSPVRINHMVQVSQFNWPSKVSNDDQNTFSWDSHNATEEHNEAVTNDVEVGAVHNEQGVLF
jgi:hypothetical protein